MTRNGTRASRRCGGLHLRCNAMRVLDARGRRWLRLPNKDKVWPGSSFSLRNEWHSNVQRTPRNNFAWMNEPSTQVDGRRTWGLVTTKVFSLPMDDFPTNEEGTRASV